MDRILIVEDDELIAELEQDYLLVEGMESDIVANGAEAVRRFRERDLKTYQFFVKHAKNQGFIRF